MLRNVARVVKPTYGIMTATSTKRAGFVRNFTGPMSGDQEAELDKWSQRVMIPVSLKNLLETGNLVAVTAFRLLRYCPIDV